MNESGRKIHIQIVRQQQQRVQHIRQLIGDVLLAPGDGPGQLLALFPLHNFQKLGGLDHERNRQLLGRMKLRPVALFPEF